MLIFPGLIFKKTRESHIIKTEKQEKHTLIKFQEGNQTY